MLEINKYKSRVEKCLNIMEITHSSEQIGKKEKYSFHLVLYRTKFVYNFNWKVMLHINDRKKSMNCVNKINQSLHSSSSSLR